MHPRLQRARVRAGIQPKFEIATRLANSQPQGGTSRCRLFYCLRIPNFGLTVPITGYTLSPMSPFDLTAPCKETLRARLLRKRTVAATGCWIWQGAIWSKGYGGIQYRYKRLAVHRVSYVIWKGCIPENLQIDHLCRNTSCFNPDHLECVTARVNTLRGTSVSARAARVTQCPKGHPYDSANTYVRPCDGGRQCKACNLEACRKYYRRKNSL